MLQGFNSPPLTPQISGVAILHSERGARRPLLASSRRPSPAKAWFAKDGPHQRVQPPARLCVPPVSLFRVRASMA